ncbi:hypothetical protein Y032_0017g3324 [Ancylostoma ceylanicum]|nr:hypothetical protein Y032_0017g3324 [Ancylostoma ceylanicum]
MRMRAVSTRMAASALPGASHNDKACWAFDRYQWKGSFKSLLPSAAPKMNRALFSRFMALRRAASMQPKRFGSGGHEVLNPGPPVTLDYMAVPFQPYAKVHAELQSKFNRYLFISATMFIVSFGLALYTDVFAMDTLTKPKSYRNRHKNN